MFKILKKIKRSQISVFVIISVVIVVLGIVFFSLHSSSLKLFTDQTASYKVKDFVNSCLDLETQKAIDKIGLHGGWLYSPYYNIKGANYLFANRNTNKYLIKSAIGYEDLGKIKIPYWYYYDDGEKQFKFNIPEYDTDSEYSIKNQIKRYIDENLNKDCLKNFAAFKNEYKIDFDPKKINTTITLDKDKVYTDLKLDLRINKVNTNETEYISKFGVKNQNDLYVTYNLARDITLAEANSSFVEKRILDFMSPYESSKSRDLLPPTYDYRMTFDFRPWEINKVEKLFKEILSSNINYIQFLNTDYKVHNLNDKLKDNSFAKALNTAYTKNYLGPYSKALKEKDYGLFKSYKDYTVTPEYEPFFPTYFSISPSMGDVILLPKPKSFINLISIFFTEYMAVYDITNPVIFQIKNSKFSNDKFSFNLALESNIDYNGPLKEKKNFNFNISKLNQNQGKTLICNPIQRISDWVKINITDPIVNGKRKYLKQRYNTRYKVNMPKTGVDNAIVTFDCKGLATCFIGKTSINANSIYGGNVTELKFRLPINCNPGKLEIYKYGYQKLVFNNLNPTLKGDINLGNVEMASAGKFNLSIRLLEPDQSVYSNGKVIGQNESGYIIFQNKENSDFVQVIEINRTNQFNQTVSLIPGNYSIKAFVIYGLPINIPSEKVCYKTGLFGKKKCKTIPGFKLKSWIRGGLELENFEVTTNEMLYNSKLVLSLIDYGIPHSYDDLSSLSNSISNLNEVSSSMKPIWEYK